MSTITKPITYYPRYSNRMVDRILEDKDVDPDAYTSELEEQINCLVCDL